MSKYNIKNLDSLQISVFAILFAAILALVFVVYYYYGSDESDTDEESTMFELPDSEKDEDKKDEYNKRIDSYNKVKKKDISPLDIDLSRLNEEEDSTNIDSLVKEDKEKEKKVKPSPSNYTYQKKSNTTVEAQHKNKDENEPVGDKNLFSRERTFRSATNQNETGSDTSKKHRFIKAVVHGQQKVSSNDKLKLRTSEEFELNGTTIPKNTFIWGNVNFRGNRVQVSISNINLHNQRVVTNQLILYDLDGMQGLNVKGPISGDGTKESAVQQGVQQGTQFRTPIVSFSTDALRRGSRKETVLIPDNHDVLIKK